MLALIIAASSAVYAVPGKKKKKEAEKTEQPKPVVLTSASDTLSYAAGKMLTRGLDQYLISELKVDTAYMAEVEAGFREGMTRDAADPKAVAHSAGLQVAQMVLGRMLPGIEKQFAGSEHTIDKTKLCEGFVSALRNDTTIMTTEHATNTFTQMRKADEEKANAAWKAKNEQWLKDNAQKEGVKTTESGLQYKVITEGHGAVAKKSSTVTVKYEGKLIDGAGDQGLDRGSVHDARGQQVGALHPAKSGLWRTRRWRHHQALLYSHLHRGAGKGQERRT